jgi:hypothetical protein
MVINLFLFYYFYIFTPNPSVAQNTLYRGRTTRRTTNRIAVIDKTRISPPLKTHLFQTNDRNT